jgi:hypothetical protein
VIINANVKVVNSGSQQNGKCKSHEKFIPEWTAMTVYQMLTWKYTTRFINEWLSESWKKVWLLYEHQCHKWQSGKFCHSTKMVNAKAMKSIFQNDQLWQYIRCLLENMWHRGVLKQGILKGEVSLYCWPPVWLVWISLFCI